MPVRQDISIWRGNNAPTQIWSLSEGVPVTGSEFFLTIAANGQTILSRDTASGTLVADAPTREIRWSFSAAESRLIPPGAIAEYELERRTGLVEITEIYGSLTGLGGLNGDVSEVDGSELDFTDADNSALQLLGWI